MKWAKFTKIICTHWRDEKVVQISLSFSKTLRNLVIKDKWRSFSPKNQKYSILPLRLKRYLYLNLKLIFFSKYFSFHMDSNKMLKFSALIKLLPLTLLSSQFITNHYVIRNETHSEVRCSNYTVNWLCIHLVEWN